MRKETPNGTQEEAIHASIASNFSHIENLASCDIDGMKHDSFKIIQKTLLTLISKQRQHTMKIIHYPQSRYVELIAIALVIIPIITM